MTHPVGYLVLWPSAACNISCRYCYRPSAALGRMPIATARTAIEQAASGGRPFHLQISGGEPTLMPDFLAEVFTLAGAEKMVRSIGIQTNATLITDELARLFAHHQVQVGVSLDGPPVVNDQLREAGDQVIAGLAKLASYQIPVRITCVLTALNLPVLPQLALWLSAFDNIRGIGLDPLVLKGAATGAVDLVAQPAELATQLPKLCAQLDALAAKHGRELIWRERRMVQTALRLANAKAPNNQNDTGYCVACRGESLAVDPKGRVFSCSQTIGQPGAQCGELKAIDWAKLHSECQTLRLPDVVGDCTGCPLAGYCPGDCPSRIAANQNQVPIACSIYRAIAEYERQR